MSWAESRLNNRLISVLLFLPRRRALLFQFVFSNVQSSSAKVLKYLGRTAPRESECDTNKWRGNTGIYSETYVEQ